MQLVAHLKGKALDWFQRHQGPLDLHGLFQGLRLAFRVDHEGARLYVETARFRANPR